MQNCKNILKVGSIFEFGSDTVACSIVHPAKSSAVNKVLRPYNLPSYKAKEVTRQMQDQVQLAKHFHVDLRR